MKILTQIILFVEICGDQTLVTVGAYVTVRADTCVRVDGSIVGAQRSILTRFASAEVQTTAHVCWSHSSQNLCTLLATFYT